MKKRVFDIISIGYKGDLPSRFFDWFISAVIILNILAMTLSTFQTLEPAAPVFEFIEVATVAVFCIEYIVRIWTADLLYPKLGPVTSRIRFFFSYDGIIDLLTILPFYFLSGFIVFRMLRVVRIFRLFKINSQLDSFNVITGVLKDKKNQIISSVFIILILMLASSIGMYSAEHAAQPDKFENAFSGIWWSISTLMTVGYGDIYPITVVGKIMAIFTAILGVGVVAVPTGIISAGFVEQYQQKVNSDKTYRDVSDIRELLADEKSGFIGLPAGEISRSFGIRVLVIIRGELTIVAADSVKVEKGDILIAEQ
ncbi:voltage-gated potassium channel [Ruminococcaceae bacterium FB2012]|nr:voltage-gated potassium channel [Ruminococcaceae bacterium FB2012]